MFPKKRGNKITVSIARLFAPLINIPKRWSLGKCKYMGVVTDLTSNSEFRTVHDAAAYNFFLLVFSFLNDILQTCVCHARS
jgi:hypothetical protein